MLIAIDAHNLENPRTGVGTYLFNLIKEWERMHIKGMSAGISFILYFKEKIPDDILSLHGRDENLQGVFNVEILKSPLGLKSNALFMHYSVSKASKKNKADILFSPNYFIPKLYKGRSVVTIHDLIYEAAPDLYNWPGFLDKLFLRKWSRRSAERADMILAPSNFTKKEVIKHYKINPDKIKVTPLAVNSAFNVETHRNQVDNVKKKYGIYDKYILYIGSIFNRRHLSEIVHAFENIFPEFQNYQLVIVGSNYTNPYIDIEKDILTINKFLQDTLKIRNRFPIIHKHYIDQEELLALYKGAWASIYLSDYEGFGLPILESMASGVPVITSKQGALMETAGDAALFVDNTKDVNEIAKKMTQIFSDKALHADLKKRGIARSVKFSWSRCAAQTMTVFKKVLSG